MTLPHKEGVIPFLSEADEAVPAIGACNTLLRRGDGWRGVNTDVEGFLAPLAARLAGRSLRGAGGHGDRRRGGRPGRRCTPWPGRAPACWS